jgi:hypothetical protein
MWLMTLSAVVRPQPDAHRREPGNSPRNSSLSRYDDAVKQPHEPATMQDLWTAEARLAEMILQLAQSQVRINDDLARTTARLDTLTDRVDKLTERVDVLVSKVDDLAEMQKHTDQRLNALIDVVDDLVRRPPAA